MLEQRENPIKVDFASLNLGANPRFSGRVIYDYNGPDGEGSVFFYCGPEATDGWLDDQGGDADELLEVLFEDLSFFAGEAENYHSAGSIPGVEAAELWALIEERLIRSGAVKIYSA